MKIGNRQIMIVLLSACVLFTACGSKKDEADKESEVQTEGTSTAEEDAQARYEQLIEENQNLRKQYQTTAARYIKEKNEVLGKSAQTFAQPDLMADVEEEDIFEEMTEESTEAMAAESGLSAEIQIEEVEEPQLEDRIQELEEENMQLQQAITLLRDYLNHLMNRD